MLVWRLARAAYPALDGEGVRLRGGRWNSPGTPVVYTAGHLSLAALEQLIHFNPDRLPEDLTAFAVEIPDSLDVERMEIEELSERWDKNAEVPELRRLGDRWALEGEVPILSVPSAVIPEERNYLINPRHAAAGEVRVARQRRFAFDPRLFE